MNHLRNTLLVALLASATLLSPAHAAENPDIARLSQRLQALDSDPTMAGAAAYERLQARQSVDALAVARGKQLPQALQIAERRVETAEIAAQTETTQREIDKLGRERSDLLVEASRQEADRARQEAERLRVQAQIQAEEAERLRQQADEESTARQQAETVLDGVATDQTAKLKAARQREAELAKREAELSGKATPAKSGKPAPKPGKKR
jgi:hypothetical protein